MLIGITGKSGSGKSTISKLFKEYDESIQIVEIDKIGHESHKDSCVKENLLKTFGEKIFNEDFSVNRKILSNIVFNDKEEMSKLCNITLKFMERKIDSLIASSDITILDYALLPKLKYFKMCDIKILVTSSYSTRSNRVMKRDNISSKKYDEIDSNSLDYIDNEFDYIIENNFNIKQLRKAIGDIYENHIISGQF